MTVPLGWAVLQPVLSCTYVGGLGGGGGGDGGGLGKGGGGSMYGGGEAAVQTVLDPSTVALPETAAVTVTDVLPPQTVALAMPVLEVAEQRVVTYWPAAGCEQDAQV
jgi:hypothetical protein